jgi:hypothetical protein
MAYFVPSGAGDDMAGGFGGAIPGLSKQSAIDNAEEQRGNRCKQMIVAEASDLRPSFAGPSEFMHVPILAIN